MLSHVIGLLFLQSPLNQMTIVTFKFTTIIAVIPDRTLLSTIFTFDQGTANALDLEWYSANESLSFKVKIPDVTC